MADVTRTAADVRAVAHDPEDTLTLDAASGYTPEDGDVVALSDADEVDEADATDANSLTVPVGIVIAVQKIRTSAGADGYRVTVLLRGLVEGFSSLSPGSDARLYTSETPGAIEDTDPTTSGVTGRAIGFPVTATQAYFDFPAAALTG